MALADTLEVDEIYLYNLTGEIEYSTREAYLNWQATPGHPVHDFMISDLTSHVEEIRKDSESDEYYKYGYYRLDDGRFVQMGVDAALVENFLAPFEVQNLLQEMGDFHLVDYVYFVNEDYSINACCEIQNIDVQINNPKVREALESRTTYSLRRFSEWQNGEVYEIFIPIFVDEDFGGTLVIAKSTKEADIMMRTAIILSILISAVVFSTFIYIMLSNYRHHKQLVSLAYEDALTGLPNKAYLEEMLAEILSSSFQDNKAIMMIHCRNLNAINSAYGFDVGDRVMKELSVRLRKFVSVDSQLFRFAGNRFVLFVQDYQSQEELSSLAESIINELEPSLDIVGRPIELKIGIVELAPSQKVVDELTHASMTIHHLESGHETQSYAFFDAGIEEKLNRQEIIAQEMADFLQTQTGQTFHLEYQPKVSLTTNQIVGFEALSRMNSPSLGRVSPVEFIPIAELQELIAPLGYWALETACQFINKLSSEGYGHLYVAVNVSVIELLQPDFPLRVKEIVKKSGVNPQNLQLEITESVLIEDFDDIQVKLRHLRDMGLTIALDDFGTGYSALSRLEELPIDYIKIDKSFIDKILLRDEQKQIIQELIAMCHKLGLTVVAEGVEHEEQQEYLKESGCDLMQGYLYSKPLSEKLALEKLKIVFSFTN